MQAIKAMFKSNGIIILTGVHGTGFQVKAFMNGKVDRVLGFFSWLSSFIFAAWALVFFTSFWTKKWCYSQKKLGQGAHNIVKKEEKGEVLLLNVSRKDTVKKGDFLFYI